MFFDAHWDHEPADRISLSPGEKVGVRGKSASEFTDRSHRNERFMERGQHLLSAFAAGYVRMPRGAARWGQPRPTLQVQGKQKKPRHCRV